jgi:hypothetical protein
MTMTQVQLTLATALAAMLGLAVQAATAGDGCCKCGGCGVRKVCRIVPEKKKLEKTVYGCKCEDICVPGKSCRGCLNCEEKCGEGDCDCCSHKPSAFFRWFDWEPGCAEVKTVKKLTKFKVTHEICSWKWKVEDACENCCPSANCVEGADGMPVEKAPPSATTDDIPMPPVPVTPAAFQRILNK